MSKLLLFIFSLAFLVSCNNDTDDKYSSKILKFVWKVDLKKVQGYQGFELPSIDGNYAYFPNGPDIECRELSTGRSIWKKRVTNGTVDYIGTNFSFNSENILIDDAFSTRLLNKLTGEQIWIAPDSGVQRVYGSLGTIDNIHGYRFPSIYLPKELQQFDCRTGNKIQSIYSDSGSFNSVVANSFGVFANTLAAYRDKVTDERISFGTLVKINPETGNLDFKIRIQPRWFKDVGYGFYLSTSSELFSKPAFDQQFGYCSFKDGTTIKFIPETGNIVWKYELPITNYRRDFPDAISVFPDEEKGLVFVTGGRDSWFCLDMETGKQLYWKRLSEYDGMIDPSSYDGNRYVFKPHTYGQYEWYIIDITTGEVVEEFDIPDDSILSQDVKNGYVAAFGVGSFYVFKIVR
ncbi:MAG: PQQ-binding-like beta-propeller repeat protein [Bacteroidetes bacterium]|nr:PQQ-binding-like beta-propeller repeat protein [Bacteroidota bacterium]